MAVAVLSSAAVLPAVPAVSAAPAVPAVPPRPSGPRDRADRLEAEHEALRRMLTETRRADQALGRVHAAVARLRTAGATDRILALVAAEVCAACDLDRVLVSTVEGSTWRPWRCHVRGPVAGGPPYAEHALCRLSVPLVSPLPEAEVVRRRVPALVADPLHDPRVHRPLVTAARTRGYVVAPVVADDVVVALLHGDVQSRGRVLTAADRDHLRLLADGLGLVLEQAALAERLARQHERITAAFAESGQALARLAAAPLPLARTDPVPACPAAHPAPADDRFTGRQQQVLELLVAGATNLEIADRLTVAETTVKSHVKQILRKLGATSRAEAIARYLRGRP